VTKDRPRNRPGNGGKSSGFSNRGGGKPWARGGGGQVRGHDKPATAERSDAQADKPWVRGKVEARPKGEAPRRLDGKSTDRTGKPHSDFQAKSKARFERRDERPDRKDDEERGHRPQPRSDHRGPRRDGARPQHHGHYDRRDAAFEENGEVWIWGIHAASAVLANPKRRISKAFVSRNAAQRAGLDADALPKFAELLEPKEIDLRLPQGAVHQGLAVRCKPLDGPDISDAAIRPERPLVILDQVTDPQNVGAIFRSAAAFGIAGVVMQTRNAPLLGGALAKAATGAIEKVDEIRAVNLSRAIDALTDAGWKVIGLDGSADQTLDEAFAGSEPIAIVMGAEGAGLRRGVAKACTGLARIPIGAEMESLNVSNAAAIAFYEAAKRNGAPTPAPKAPLPAPGEDMDDDGFADEAD
jgi:23S rRNA (guanosine2251-2'-O)-methyltransferase